MTTAITVFLIDQDESILQAIARLLKASGFEVVCSRNVEELLARKLPPKDSVVIADVSTVLKFADRFPRALHENDQLLPVIYLAGHDSKWTRDEAKRVGATAYFRKPVDEQALIDAITFAVQLTTNGQTSAEAQTDTPSF